MKLSLGRLALLSLLGIAAGACTVDAEPGEEVSAVSEHVAFSPEEIGAVIQLVNDSGTDLAKLDHDLHLDSRAAANIIAYRNGDDGEHLTADDNRIDTLEELDAIKYVGQMAISTLRHHAVNNPLPPVEHVEGVTFDGTQVIAVLWGVNNASLEELDDDVQLDVRAAQALYNNAPHATIGDVARQGFVGAHALKQLRFNAKRWHAEMENGNTLAGTFDDVTFDEGVAQIALDLANHEPWNGLVESGMWATGAQRIVDGRPYAGLDEVAAVPGVGTRTMEQLHYFAFNLAAGQ